MKEDVLADLPPKIIQDYHCELSPLQVRLYGAFAKSELAKQVQAGGGGSSSSGGGGGGGGSAPQPQRMHIFKALQYLRKVCNHPRLVLTPSHPWHAEVTRELKKEGRSLTDITLSAKVSALRQLLVDCGLDAPSSTTGRDAVVNQHRFLIFAQSKAMLDIIADDLFAAHMPWATYLRLDGSVVADKRQGIVDSFNRDPSIDALLLTTAVGH
jgi:TATA-binding protein-associated factor